MLHYIQCSPMNKLCGEAARKALPFERTRSLKGQHIFFQIILWSDAKRSVSVELRDCSDTFNEIFLAKSVPVTFSHYSDDPDGNYLSDGPSTIPDCLIPLSPWDTISVGSDPVILWVTARSHFAGEYKISYQFSTAEESITTSFSLKTLDMAIRAGRCTVSAAISPYSIATAEGVPPYCDVFWEHLSRHFKLAEKQGITNIITPLFSSKESQYHDRNPDQLLKIKVIKKKYEFNFDTLDSWLLDGMKHGIDHFTFTPLFPSMIDQKCPLVYADNFRDRYLLFGEEDHILSDNYLDFVCDLLRKLIRHLKEIKLMDRVTFIMTNEFSAEYTHVYAECFSKIKRSLSGQIIISRTKDFVGTGFEGFPYPIVPIHAVEPYFIYPFSPKITFDIDEAGGFMNQLIAAPSMRIRSFGLLCYLQNFNGIVLDRYNCNISPITKKAFDPLISPDGDGAYPAGSLSMVYNHTHGPFPSIRLHMLRAAIQDSVVLFLAEDYILRERLIGMIERELPVSAGRYPTDIERYHKFMEKIYDIYERNLEKRKKK